MNRIDITLSQLKKENRKLLSPYITAGDPNLPTTLSLMHSLVAGGANILEIGIPFSDPMAEGPVIQAAMERALENKVSCVDVLKLISDFRRSDQTTPIVLMGYLNPIEYYGYEQFAQDAVSAGVDGTIIVDLPPEESEAIATIWHAHAIYPIYLCSPTTSDARMQLINQFAKGYLYFVSLKGVTGSSAFDLEQVKTVYLERKAQSPLPIMVGFGIKTPEMAASVTAFSDGVIVGAALIQAIEEANLAGKDVCEKASSLIHNMRIAVDNGKIYE